MALACVNQGQSWLICLGENGLEGSQPKSLFHSRPLESARARLAFLLCGQSLQTPQYLVVNYYMEACYVIHTVFHNALKL
jgi:hypothetical protein